MIDNKCPCGSGRDLGMCCGPFLAGLAQPQTAEALMRSRYTAYVKQNIDYIIQTCTTEQGKSTDVEATRQWATESEWLGLKILTCEKGGPLDQVGTVEFVATYKAEGKTVEHHELASFVREGGKWLFQDGREVPRTVVRTEAKVGRNEPCPCGSGKKYKQCHGK